MSRVLQKIDDRVRNLIDLGKERGYVIHDEVNAALPAATRTSAEIKSLFAAFEHHNVHVYENAAAAKAAIHLSGENAHPTMEGREDGGPDEEAEVEEASHSTDKNNDAVRVYLREMGRVPLLKREGEVAIAKRMERGHALVLRTISRSPLVLKEIIAIGKEIDKGTRSIREMSAHGFRASASTLLNESGKFSPDAIEAALAHQDEDAVRRAYARGAYWDERVRMANWWADHLDTLRRGAEVIPIAKRGN